MSPRKKKEPRGKDEESSPEDGECTALALQLDPYAEVIKWLIAGKSESDVRESITYLFPGENADGVLTRASDHFEQAAHCQLSVVIGWALEAYRDLYRRQLEASDFEGARKTMKDLVATASKYVHEDDGEGGEQEDGDDPDEGAAE